MEIIVDGAPWWGDGGPAADPRESVLAAYRALGPRLFETARGAFAVAIVDHARRRVLLAIDRMGICALAHVELPGGGIAFGTSASELAARPDVRAALSRQALYDYLHFHMVPSPTTVYAGVCKLQPGHVLRYEDGRLAVERYWHPAFATSCDTPLPVLREELLSTLRGSVLRALAGSRAPGAFLSGGLDSSAVVGSMAAVSTSPVRAFSVGFAAEEYNELDYARVTNAHFHTEGHEIEVTPVHVADAIPLLAAAFDEPFGNSSAVPTYFCALGAREHGVERLLAGDGGDELFGGNRHYSRQGIFEQYYRLPSPLRRWLCEGLLLRAIPDGAPFPFGKARSYIEQAAMPLPRRLHSWDFMFRTPSERVFEADFLASVSEGHPDELMSSVYAEPGTDAYLDRLLNFDWQFVLADNDLRKVGTACRLAGVDVRYPMLDTAVVDFSLRLTPSMKVRGQKLRPFFKAASRGFLPDAVIEKEKHGFGLPFGLWLKSEGRLRDLVMDTLDALGRRGIVRPAFLAELVAEHRAGHASYYGYAIWDLVMLEQWLQAGPGRSVG